MCNSNKNSREIKYAKFAQSATRNASELVQKVESGEFIFDYEGTKKIVRLFLDKVLHKNPEIDTFTLSSTHLPWLSPFFTELYPKISFIDPADKTVASLPLNNLGTGQILGIVTEGKDHDYSQKNFRKILNRLGIEIPLQFLSFQVKLVFFYT